MFGAKLTLLVLTSQRLARIDLAGPRRALRVERVSSCPAIHTPDLAATVAIAYRLHAAGTEGRSLMPARPRSVIVLSEDVWNDVVTLPIDVTILLSPAELRQALAIEAESYSGISAFHSQVTTRQLLDASTNLVDTSTNFHHTHSWWLAQVLQSDLTAMATGLAACGANFIGVTHIEADSRSGQRPTTHLTSLELDDELRLFGERWAKVLSSDGKDLLVCPSTAQSSSSKLAWLQSSAALLTALACAGHYQYDRAQLNKMDARIQDQHRLLAAHESTATKLHQAEAKLQQSQPPAAATAAERPPILVKQTEPVVEAALVRADKSRWANLLSALAEHTPADCCIESWQQQGLSTTVHGYSLSAEAIHQLAYRLEQAFQTEGWQVAAPVMHTDEAALVRFELTLRFDPATTARSWQ